MPRSRTAPSVGAPVRALLGEVTLLLPFQTLGSRCGTAPMTRAVSSKVTLEVCEREDKPRPAETYHTRPVSPRAGQGGAQPGGVHPLEVVLLSFDEGHRGLLAVLPRQLLGVRTGGDVH